MSGIAFRPRKQRRKVQLNMTSLIDVLFLLLIFFMLTGTFKRAGELELQLPDSTSSAPADGDSELRQVELALLEDGSVMLDGEAVEMEQLGGLLERLREQDQSASVMLKAEEGARHGDVVTLLDLVRGAGFAAVGIGTQIEGFAEPGVQSPE